VADSTELELSSISSVVEGLVGRLRFRILGTLEVEEDGELLAIGGPKLRVILGTLLPRAGALVPVDALFEVLWGDDPPRTARTAVQFASRRSPPPGNRPRRRDRDRAGRLSPTSRPGDDRRCIVRTAIGDRERGGGRR
jgi:hypothetical protein